jgi:hypothetical protein
MKINNTKILSERGRRPISMRKFVSMFDRKWGWGLNGTCPVQSSISANFQSVSLEEMMKKTVYFILLSLFYG